MSFLQVNHALLEEIREINERLIDIVVDVSDEDLDPSVAASASEGREGTIVKCSFSAISLSPNLKSHYTSAQMVSIFHLFVINIIYCGIIYLSLFISYAAFSLQSPIQPLRLLVPVNYPNCSPILLDKLPVDVR